MNARAHACALARALLAMVLLAAVAIGCQGNQTSRPVPTSPHAQAATVPHAAPADGGGAPGYDISSETTCRQFCASQRRRSCVEMGGATADQGRKVDGWRCCKEYLTCSQTGCPQGQECITKEVNGYTYGYCCFRP